MGKADQKRTQNAITSSTQRNLENTGAGINEETNRVNDLIPRSDAERSSIWGNYSGMAKNDADYYTKQYQGALNSNANAGSSSSSGSGGGNVNPAPAAPAQPDYLSVFRELSGKTGGFDPTRLSNINSVTDRLRNTSGNFGATDRSISGLQDFAKTGGLDSTQLGAINRDTLQEFEKTGGYDSGQIANIRNRANSSVPSFYQNLKDTQDRERATTGNIGPGWDRAGFRMARDAAHQSADTARDTEIGIGDSVRAGRMAASSELAKNALSTAGLQSQNTLSGYGTSGSLDIAKQKQIAEDAAASGNLDLGTQNNINMTRLGATSGISQDTLGRMQIGASSGASAAARADANARWAAEMAQQDRYHGDAGLLATYGTRPEELIYNQGLLRDYRNDQMTAGQHEVNNRIGASTIPGIGSSIKQGIGIAGDIAGMASGGFGGFDFGGGNPNASVDDFRRYGGFGG